jgi:hypothetical protein
MRTTFRWDKDMECLVEVRSNSNYFEDPKGPHLISDDMGAGVNGLRAMYRKDKKHFDSKSRYRADVKAHGLEISGNDDMRGSPPPPPNYGQAVNEAYQQFAGNHNGMADRVRELERITKWKRNNGG